MSRNDKRRTQYRYPFEEISTRAALDWPLSRQWPLVTLFTAAALRAGLVPADALKRAVEGLGQLRAHARERALSLEDQVYLQHLAIGAMECRSQETGFTLAHRAIEAWRLMGEWRAGRWSPVPPKKRPQGHPERRLPPRLGITPTPNP